MTTMPLPATAVDSRVAPTSATRISVARGDGIGPEIMSATLRVLRDAGALIDVEEIEVGQREYLRGVTSGIDAAAWDSIRRNRVLLKAPITTPQGSGYKSLNVTMRKRLGLFANLRPCSAYAPFVPTRHPKLDVVIVRENEEDTYAGVEHRQTREVVQCLKLISEPGTERIARYAFDYARAHGRRKVTCMTKDNIMKLTDGLFRRTVERVAEEYPDIAYDHMIVDIGAARLADAPEQFDVVVLPNLYGDILSDVAAEIAGSVGLAGSANIGPSVAMFEAIHGSAPDIAGRDIANPSGLLQAAVLMLSHVGQTTVAEQIFNAWLRTIEDGIHTADIYSERSSRRVGTQAFADAVIERLGQKPNALRSWTLGGDKQPRSERKAAVVPRASKVLVGVDVFLDWDDAGRDASILAERVMAASEGLARLSVVTNRGVMVWPNGFSETQRTDHWRCRLVPLSGDELPAAKIPQLLQRLLLANLDVIKTENLYTFDGLPGFSLAQGQ